jgi:hypothetical protein
MTASVILVALVPAWRDRRVGGRLDPAGPLPRL